MSKWRPIETAPEAEDILGFFPDASTESQVMICHRLTDPEDGEPWWYEQNVDRCPGALIVEPSHWMPLPEPPEAA